MTSTRLAPVDDAPAGGDGVGVHLVLVGDRGHVAPGPAQSLAPVGGVARVGGVGVAHAAGAGEPRPVSPV